MEAADAVFVSEDIKTEGIACRYTALLQKRRDFEALKILTI